MSAVTIDGKSIGENNPCYIVVEIGSNYNGDLDTAKKMLDIIKESGADAAKFQIFKENKLYPKDAGKVDYLNSEITINEIVKKAEVPDHYHKELYDYCKKIKLTYLCTPTDEEVADYLESIGVAAYKIASYALTHHNLLKHIAGFGKPMILSTGASHLHEIAESVKLIREQGNDQIILMQCVAQYPAQLEHSNLKVMNTLRTSLGIPAVGISDHSKEPFVVPFAAVALGANIVEKHFTLDRNQEGPDHSFALEPDELIEMVKGIKSVEKTLGTEEKNVTPVEKELREFTERCIFVSQDLEKGTEITKQNTAVLRPGKKKTGIPAKFYDIILGSKLNDNKKNGDSLQWNDILNIS
jgi:N-acetylneuraminate synthase